MTAAWAGALCVGDCWALWRGRSGDNRLHRHFAAQAVRAPGGVAVIDAAGHEVRDEVVLIDPFVLHRLEPTDDATILYLEPSAPHDAELAAQMGWVNPNAPILAGSPSFWRERRANATSATPLIDAARARIDALIDGGPVTLAAITDMSGLSPDRFRHRFVAEAGLTVRRYILWRRLRRAAREIGDGADATTAAHTAGFADAAHFARTLAIMFGVTASAALLPAQARRNGSTS